MQFSPDPQFARQADEGDVLQSFRKLFRVPMHKGKEQIYFLGNSLGLQPVATKKYITGILDQWADYGVEGFFEGEKPWLDYHDSLIASISSITGALPHEIAVMNQLTVNLHLLFASFYRPELKRNRIVCEAKAFPSDRYMLETHLRYLGLDPAEIIIEVAPEKGSHAITTDQIEKVILENADRVAMVFWGGVNYYTGQLFDICRITELAHAAGAVAGFDLAHAAGNVTLDLHGWNVDFAAWCNYKYLNSGPGAVATAYIHERYHNDDSLPRFGGWWGYDKSGRFKMEKKFSPAKSAEGWQLSTPSIILYAMHKASLDVFTEARMKRLAEKGSKLSDYCIALLNNIQESFPSKRFEVLTPQSRGCQVSLLFHNNSLKVFDQLKREGIFADWREPGVIRIAPVPLYNTYQEVWAFAQIVKKILA